MTAAEMKEYRQKRLQEFRERNTELTDEEKRERNRLHQQDHRENHAEEHAEYMQRYRAEHSEELKQKRREYKARKRQEAIDAGIIKPREPKEKTVKKSIVRYTHDKPAERVDLDENMRQIQRDPKQEPEPPKEPKPKKEPKRHTLNQPVSEELRLAVVIGENPLRKSETSHVVILKYPLCNRYSVNVVHADCIDTKYYDDAEIAFNSVRYRDDVKRYRDCSAEALRDYRIS